MRTDALAPPRQAVLPPTRTTPPAPAAGVKKLAFGKLAVKKAETRTAYPVYHHAEAALIAARIKTRTEELKALEGALETDKAELKQTVGVFYFQTNHGKAEVPSSISVPSEAGEVLVSFTDRYTKTEDDSGIVALLGAERAEKWFAQQNEIKIACNQIALDRQQEFVDELTALLDRFNAGDAAAITSSIKPVKGFHTARHTVLTIEENLALEQVIPIVAMVKTQGRGDK
jgi:hypothetical protein